ncbi:AbrB/MazE/SpoVT family DNA-binding domain-containing protein [Halobacteriales archaeon Cl-PHB]
MGKKPFTRTVQDLGNGTVGGSFPEALARRHGIEPGDEVPIDYDPDTGEVSFLLE